MTELLQRYGSVFAAAWRIRHKLDSPPKLEYELAFLPASLELAETPVHPARRWAMRTVAGLAVLIVLVAAIGKLDIVITAKGKLVPNARVKVVQPAITGVVKSILVKDGQRVKTGDLLLELDPTQAAADTAKAHSADVAAALAAARARALLLAQQNATAPAVPAVEGETAEEQRDAQRFAYGVYREYRDKEASAQAELIKRQAELEGTMHDIDRLKAIAPLAREQANDYKTLVADKYVPKEDYLDKEQNALQREHELAATISHARELQAAIVSQQADIAALTSGFRRDQLDTLDKANQQLAQSGGDETKAKTRQGLMSLCSPVSGTVQQLAVHTLGGVVTTAQSLMEIVPDDALEVEANVENKDVGFIKAGQEAIVKIEAFPYSRYGFLHGTVRSVSNDATQSNKQALTYVARINLPTNRMHIKDQWIDLTPGMAVTVEIKTGKRSVARYFLDPLVQTAQESMRER
jgi:hemolysin D